MTIIFSDHNIGTATVADSVGDVFQPRYILQQAPLATSHDSSSSMPRTADDQRYGSGLSPETTKDCRT